MSKTPKYDVAVKKILDATELGERTCEVLGEKWTVTEQELAVYRRFNVPPIMVSFNTFGKVMAYYDIGYQFWWNKHFDTGKPVLSFHHPAAGVKVLPDVEWYARDFSDTFETPDPSKPFFPQIRALQIRVPFLATFDTVKPENSITLLSFGDRDSLFTFACRSNRSYFSAGVMGCEESSLGFLGEDVTRSHWFGHSLRLHNGRYIRESLDCIDSCFLFDCRNCESCFGAVNKRNKKYVWFNEQLSKEEWERRRAEVDLGRRDVVEKWSKAFDELLMREGFWPENFNVGIDQSVGDYLHNAVRCTECFCSAEAPSDNYRCSWIFGTSSGNAYNWGTVNNTETFGNVTSPDCSKTKFTYRSFRMDESEYCMMCADCQFCFGCVGLRKKKYCILNKQYTEDEYWRLVDEIKTAMLARGEYGKFFPVSMSTSYIPESGTITYCGTTPEEIAKIGSNVFDPTAEGATGEERIDRAKVRQASEIPNSIDDLTPDWIGVPIFDLVAKRTFSFFPAEVEHYRALRIAPPTEHFIRRLHAVARSGQMAQFEHRRCAKCHAEILVSKSVRYPNRRILCKKCYLAHIETNG